MVHITLLGRVLYYIGHITQVLIFNRELEATEKSKLRSNVDILVETFSDKKLMPAFIMRSEKYSSSFHKMVPSSCPVRFVIK